MRPGGKPAWSSVEAYLGAEAAEPEVVAAIKLPPVTAGERFWSFKASPRTPSVCALSHLRAPERWCNWCNMGRQNRASSFTLLQNLQVAERHWNAHAFINMALWLKLDATKNGAGPCIAEARVVFGYPAAEKGGACTACPP